LAHLRSHRTAAALALIAAASVAVSAGLCWIVLRGARRLFDAGLLELWWAPGKYLALVLVSVLPPAWLHGDPAPGAYAPAAASADFVLGCAVAAWACVIFVALVAGWLGLRRASWRGAESR
jgi:hypothetical protein